MGATPDDAFARLDYVCSNCGGRTTTVLKSRPSVDDRFAIGWCDSCDYPYTLDELNARRAKQNAARQKRATETKTDYRPLPVIAGVPPRKEFALVREDHWDPKVRAGRLEAERRRSLVRKLERGTPMTKAEAAEARAIRDTPFAERFPL